MKGNVVPNSFFVEIKFSSDTDLNKVFQCKKLRLRFSVLRIEIKVFIVTDLNKGIQCYGFKYRFSALRIEISG